MFLLFPLSASSLRCVCVARYLSLGSSCPAGERTRTLSAKCCHIMSLFGSLILQQRDFVFALAVFALVVFTLANIRSVLQSAVRTVGNLGHEKRNKSTMDVPWVEEWCLSLAHRQVLLGLSS